MPSLPQVVFRRSLRKDVANILHGIKRQNKRLLMHGHTAELIKSKLALAGNIKFTKNLIKSYETALDNQFKEELQAVQTHGRNSIQHNGILEKIESLKKLLNFYKNDLGNLTKKSTTLKKEIQVAVKNDRALRQKAAILGVSVPAGSVAALAIHKHRKDNYYKTVH